jgi:peptidoglycan/LPS O-acetylase OafA/YrhL
VLGTKYQKDIQVLRGIAVSAVVLFHARASSFPNGFLGVDVFFVISGFVITPLILKIFADQEINWEGRLSNLKKFYKRRFYRLAPALVISLVFSAIILFLLGPLTNLKGLAIQGIATLALVGNLGAYLYLGRDYFDPIPNPLIHTWSLSVEAQIYILLPLILMLIFRKGKKYKKTTLIIFTLIAFISFLSFNFQSILSVLYSYFSIETPAQFSFYSPVDRIWQFTIGGICFLLVSQREKSVIKFSKFINLVFVSVVIIILFGSTSMSQKNSSIIATSITVVVIALKSFESLPNLLSSKLEWIGDRSYSIYLVHMPLLYVAKYSPLIQSNNFKVQIMYSAIAVVASILIGALIYNKIEVKFRELGKVKTSSRFSTVIFVAILLIPVFTFALLYRVTASITPVPNKVEPWNWDSQCKIYSPYPNVNDKPCKYGNFNTGKSILLFGDSHAASISRAIITLGKSNNMDTFVFTFEGCGFAVDEKGFNPSYSYPYLTPECIKHNNLILDFVREKNPTVVIWAHRSSSIMVVPNNPESRYQYNEMIARNIDELMGENQNLINIGSLPELDMNLSWLQATTNPIGFFSPIPFEDNFFWENKTESSFYVNTTEIFCPLKKCINKSEKGWLFHDADHPSELGANMLLPKLQQYITEIAIKVGEDNN